MALAWPLIFFAPATGAADQAEGSARRPSGLIQSPEFPDVRALVVKRTYWHLCACYLMASD